MNQGSLNEKAEMLKKISSINQVEGFDPTPFALEYTNLNTNETRKSLPVNIQLAWFWQKYPEGKIATRVTAENDVYVATARIYPSREAGQDCFLAEATAARGFDPAKPFIFPREWAQTAAIGTALRYAGFGLQFGTVSDNIEECGENEFLAPCSSTGDSGDASSSHSEPQSEKPMLTREERLQQAMNMPCPISKYGGKTLGDVLTLDPKALNWVANKFSGDQEIVAAAKMICEYALQEATA